MRNSVAGVGCSVLGGGPSRTRFYRLNRSFLPRENLAGQGLRNQRLPAPKRVEIAGPARLIAHDGKIVGVSGPPAHVVAVDPSDGEPVTVTLPVAPEVGIPDCVAATANQLYIIHHDGAVVWDNMFGAVSAQVPGHFASQLVHSRGWLLIEPSGMGTGAVLRFFDLEGNPLESGRSAVIEGLAHPHWAMPIGDDDAVYLAAGLGELWKVQWSGETSRLCNLNASGGATLILDGRYLWFLPVGGEYNVTRIDLSTASRQEAQVGRPLRPLAAAVDMRAPSGRIWLGFQEKPYLCGVKRDLPVTAPRELTNAAGPVRELAIAADPEGSALLLGLVEGEKDVRLQGWWLDDTMEPVGIFDPSYPRDAKVGPHLLIARHYAVVWYSDGGETQIFIYELR